MDDAQAAVTDGAGVPVERRERRPNGSPRNRTILLRLGEEEYEAIVAAAARSGLTPTGWAAEAAVSLARNTAPPVPATRRAVLVELMQARIQLRRFGTNVNQAVAALNATGEAPVWLRQAVELCARVVDRIDAATAMLARRR